MGQVHLHPLGGKSRGRLSQGQAEKSSTHTQTIFTCQPIRITLSIGVTRLCAHHCCALAEHLLILYPMSPRSRTCSNNAGRFQNRSTVADIYQASLRAYLGLDSDTHFDLEIKVVLDPGPLIDIQVVFWFSGCFYLQIWYICGHRVCTKKSNLISLNPDLKVI